MRNILFVLFFSISIFTQGQVTFQSSYGSKSGELIFRSIRQTPDGGYILIANHQDSIGGFCIIKLNSTGDTLWSRSIGSSNNEVKVNSIELTNDGGYIIAGGITFQTTNTFIAKLDSTGNIIWSKQYGSGYPYSNAFSARQISGGGYVIVGNISNSISDILLIATDSSGNKIWAYSYGGQGIDVGYDFAEVPNGYVVYAEYEDSARCLFETNLSGLLLWQENYSNSYSINYDSKSFCQTADSGFAFVSGATPYLIKTDSMGSPVLGTNYYDPSAGIVANSIFQTADRGYVISGTHDNNSLFIIKINAIGDTLWVRKYTGNYSSGAEIRQTSDGGYIVGGNISQNNITEIYLIKTDTNGNSNCNEVQLPLIENLTAPSYTWSWLFSSMISTVSIYPTITMNLNDALSVLDPCLGIGIEEPNLKTSQIKISLSPNPFHSTTILKTGEDYFNQEVELTIYNSMGTFIRVEHILNITTYILHRSGLSNGLYFYELRTTNSELISTGKFVVE